jgi:hypothetical protein
MTVAVAAASAIWADTQAFGGPVDAEPITPEPVNTRT